MKILIYPNKKLRQKATKVRHFDDGLKKTVDEMIRLMRENNGVGLSAPQVEILKKIVIVELIPKEEDEDKKEPIPLTVLINPKITKLSPEKEILNEGCLSFPGKKYPVERAINCNILAQDLAGNRIKLRPKGLTSRICQHEIDHLNGVLIVDRQVKQS